MKLLTPEEFVDKIHACPAYKLACLQARRRKIIKPNEADILELMSEIVARANERNINLHEEI